ncbi:hypothetical protein EUGRSUZ_K00709 [Eucalyptus grandis]|uniref:Uncharacterized protein n=2 Tax=Eucalyptus grandis TaxID=71139 RepID=A0ACC3IRC0_EUCGR|nr:hypothetical protein EUGRSUZ_K00709 [Eucalyptus grandis]
MIKRHPIFVYFTPLGVPGTSKPILSPLTIRPSTPEHQHQQRHTPVPTPHFAFQVLPCFFLQRVTRILRRNEVTHDALDYPSNSAALFFRSESSNHQLSPSKPASRANPTHLLTLAGSYCTIRFHTLENYNNVKVVKAAHTYVFSNLQN